MTLIIGSEGSMGKRYKAILHYLNEPYSCIDLSTSKEEFIHKTESCSRSIVCSPTDTHHTILKEIIPIGKPILCEKPISKKLFELSDILNKAETYNTQFNMTFQYTELVNTFDPAPSSYDYFRTGNDGLYWDCLQIIALACGEVEIRNTSPVWKCTINGQELLQSSMDMAYVDFTRKWINGLIKQSNNDLYKIHQKVEVISNERRG